MRNQALVGSASVPRPTWVPAALVTDSTLAAVMRSWPQMVGTASLRLISRETAVVAAVWNTYSRNQIGDQLAAAIDACQVMNDVAAVAPVAHWMEKLPLWAWALSDCRVAPEPMVTVSRKLPLAPPVLPPEPPVSTVPEGVMPSALLVRMTGTMICGWASGTTNRDIGERRPGGVAGSCMDGGSGAAGW